MKVSSLVVLLGFASLTISCAHKSHDKTHDHKAQIDKQQDDKELKIAERKDSDKELTYTCLVGKDKRLVTLVRGEKRCEVSYTKFGDEKQVAWAESTPSICHDTFGKIRTNIEGSGYKCVEGRNASFEQEHKKENKRAEEKAVETAAADLKK